MEGIVTELLKYAFTGVNVIPTMMLIVIQCYWIIASIGFLDLDFFDFDVDLEGAEGSGALNAIAVFINIGEVPFALVFSMIVLNFWIIAMLMYFLPIEAGGLVSGILLLPALIASMYITKLEILPLKKIFLERINLNDVEHKVLDKICTLKCDLEYGRLGQAGLKQEGPSIVINVKTQFNDESFKKDEVAFVFRKDEEKDIYYIAKTVMGDEFYKEMEEL